MPAPGRERFTTTQPGRTIWSTYCLISGLLRLPFWIFYFIPRGLRQDKRWSYKKAISVRIMRAYLTWASDVEVPVPLPLTPGNEKDQWVALDPAEPKYYVGITTADSKIKPAKIGGTWYPSAPANGEKPKQVVLHFHGGAYVIGDGRKKDTEFLAKTLLKNTNAPYVFCSQYRLAGDVGGRFPAALQDAITSYMYLLKVKNIDPANIIVSGDSAGGNLTLALLRYLVDNGKQLGIPNPLCAWLWSPWVDPYGAVRDKSGFDLSPQAPTDYLNNSFGAWGAECYAPDKPTGLTSDHKYINFLANPFSTPIPLYFSWGENEVLSEDDKNAYNAFTKIQGNKTGMSIETAAVHDIILVGFMSGFEEEAAEAAKKAAKWTLTL